MPTFQESKTITGVILVQLTPFGDERGRFIETFRKEWFPQRSWQILQTNRSDSQENVLRGLHYHHKQVDYWYIATGKIRAGLVDLRPNSATYLAGETVDMAAEDNLGLFIPIGVAHGIVALKPSTLIYTVDNYYDGDDEFGVAWNDPEINLDWAVSDPLLSPRDQNNPLLKDIPPENLPKPL
jgi:dTDP-4-dehydrorhamnose 3,5-epimerase